MTSNNIINKHTVLIIEDYVTPLDVQTILDWFNDNSIAEIKDITYHKHEEPEYYVEDKIFVPLFHSYRGINDRFAFGSANVMSVYMNSYINIYNKIYENVNIGNAEYFMMLNLLNNNIKYEKLKNILFNRVRMDGTILKDCF